MKSYLAGSYITDFIKEMCSYIYTQQPSGIKPILIFFSIASLKKYWYKHLQNNSG